MTRNRRKSARVPSESLISVDRVDDSILLAHTLDLLVEGVRFQAQGSPMAPPMRTAGRAIPAPDRLCPGVAGGQEVRGPAPCGRPRSA